jgi:hypothetical protein
MKFGSSHIFYRNRVINVQKGKILRNYEEHEYNNKHINNLVLLYYKMESNEFFDDHNHHKYPAVKDLATC